MINPEILKYNKAQTKTDKAICDLLASEIDKRLTKTENKNWHRTAVWFMDGNPLVGYSKRKDGVQLLFWSGQTFKEAGLKKEGSFKAAEVRYTNVDEIVKKDLTRWLKKSKEIQWDYKNIVKRKGVLKRLV